MAWLLLQTVRTGAAEVVCQSLYRRKSAVIGHEKKKRNEVFLSGSGDKRWLNAELFDRRCFNITCFSLFQSVSWRYWILIPSSSNYCRRWMDSEVVREAVRKCWQRCSAWEKNERRENTINTNQRNVGWMRQKCNFTSDAIFRSSPEYKDDDRISF